MQVQAPYHMVSKEKILQRLMQIYILEELIPRTFVVIRAVTEPFLSVIELIITVVPCAKKIASAMLIPDFVMALKTPFS